MFATRRASNLLTVSLDIMDSIRRAYDLNAKILLEITCTRQDRDFSGDKNVASVVSVAQ